MRAARGLAPALLLLCAACVTVRQALPSPSAVVPPSTALPVPYVSQSLLLCGGAAVAMVERWWGRRGVFGKRMRRANNWQRRYIDNPQAAYR